MTGMGLGSCRNMIGVRLHWCRIGVMRMLRHGGNDPARRGESE